MRPIKLLIGAFLGGALLSGCATGPQVASPLGEGQASQGIDGQLNLEELKLPNVELTEDILNDLLVAEIAVQRSQYSTAVDVYARLAKSTEDPRIAERATRIAVFSRDYPEALKLAKLWMKLSPKSVEGRQILTALQVKSGDYDGALASLEEVLAQADRSQDRYLLIIRLLGRDQDRNGALEVVRRYLEKHDSDVAGLYAHSQLALRAGKIEDAEKSVNRLLELEPDLTRAVILRTRILQESDRDAEALEYIDDVVSRNSKDTELRIAYGRMLVDADRPEDALEQFKRVLAIEPDNYDILFAAGLVALRLEKMDEAEKYFLKLNYRSVRVDETSYYLGRIEEIRGNFEKAIRRFSDVTQGENYLNAQIRSALLQARLGDVDAARAHLGAVQARSPGQHLRLFLAEGEILRDVGRYEDAMVVYDRALQEIPDNTELLYARAMVAERLDRLDVLEHDLRAILEKEPDHVDALNSLGYTLADKTDRFEEAHTYVKRALELKPDSFYILDSMGWVLYRMGRLDESIDFLRRAMELSLDPEIAAHLGEVLWVKGDKDEARNTWQRALEQSPESKALLNVINRLEK